MTKTAREKELPKLYFRAKPERRGDKEYTNMTSNRPLQDSDVFLNGITLDQESQLTPLTLAMIANEPKIKWRPDLSRE